MVVEEFVPWLGLAWGHFGKFAVALLLLLLSSLGPLRWGRRCRQSLRRESEQREFWKDLMRGFVAANYEKRRMGQRWIG